MDNEKIQNLLGDESFLEKIIQMDTSDEMQTAFKNEGVELSDEEAQFLHKSIHKIAQKGEALSESELENIAGGDSHDVKNVGKGIGATLGGISALVLAATPLIIYACEKLPDAIRRRKQK